ncbi:hypothetical protein ACRALDRAFT_2019878 [Sodiomyces alcalophilus JCM 7366]|uniref:uncharacterized protein n=1 Tax=Sodiomyces alcalophilus JCM 7366 TaxID=591952 RepID=UPI0039B64DC8
MLVHAKSSLVLLILLRILLPSLPRKCLVLHRYIPSKFYQCPKDGAELVDLPSFDKISSFHQRKRLFNPTSLIPITLIRSPTLRRVDSWELSHPDEKPVAPTVHIIRTYSTFRIFYERTYYTTHTREEAFCSLLNSGVVHCLPYPSSPVTDLSPYKPNYPAHPFEDQEPYRKPLKQKRSLSHLILCQGHLRHRDSRSSPNTANESKLPAPIFSNRPSRFIRRRSRRQQRQVVLCQ